MNEKKTKRPLWRIFWICLRIGFFTFGGGLAMVPQMAREFVEREKWVEEDEMTDLFALAQSLPGVFAVNASVLAGYRCAGYPGAMLAALGSTLPSFLVLVVVTIFYEAFIQNPYVTGAMRGFRAAVTGTLIVALYKLGKPVFKKGWFSWLLFVPALAIALFVKINVVWLLLAGGCIGGAVYAVKKGRERA